MSLDKDSGHWTLDTRVTESYTMLMSALPICGLPLTFSANFKMTSRKRKPAFESMQVHRDMDQITKVFCCEYLVYNG